MVADVMLVTKLPLRRSPASTAIRLHDSSHEASVENIPGRLKLLAAVPLLALTPQCMGRICLQMGDIDY